MKPKFRRPRMKEVLGVKYKIRYRNLDKADYDGRIYPSERLIVVHSGLDQEATYGTIRHELMHALLMVSGVTESLTPEQEEALCVLMENGYKSLIL